jgi:hypothetical protein
VTLAFTYDVDSRGTTYGTGVEGSVPALHFEEPDTGRRQSNGDVVRIKHTTRASCWRLTCSSSTSRVTTTLLSSKIMLPALGARADRRSGAQWGMFTAADKATTRPTSDATTPFLSFAGQSVA